MSDISKFIKDVVASPLGSVIASVGQGVADAQAALDEGSLAKTLEIYSEGDEEILNLLKELGYMPTFYTLPETTGEVKVALKMSGAQGAATMPRRPQISAALSRSGLNSPGVKNKMYASPVDAGYANRYGYNADVSAQLSFKIVPVPPPSGAEELRILPNVVGRTLSEAEQTLNALGLVVSVLSAEGNEVESPDDGAVVATQTPAFNEARVSIVRIEDQINLTLEV